MELWLTTPGLVLPPLSLLISLFCAYDFWLLWSNCTCPALQTCHRDPSLPEMTELSFHCETLLTTIYTCRQLAGSYSHCLLNEGYTVAEGHAWDYSCKAFGTWLDTISWCSMGSHWALQLFWQHPPSGNTICDTDHTHACGMHTHLHLLTGLWLVLSLLSLYVDLVLTIHLCCCEILLTHAHSSISTVCCIAMLS